MREYMRERRAVTPGVTPVGNRVGVTGNLAVTPQNVTPERVGVTGKVVENGVTPGEVVTPVVTPECEHGEIVKVVGKSRHLSYTKYEEPLRGLKAEVERSGVETKEVACPCCGKVWVCRRPDIQSAYCLKCERKGGSWREEFPYKRPEGMATKGEALENLGRIGVR